MTKEGGLSCGERRKGCEKQNSFLRSQEQTPGFPGPRAEVTPSECMMLTHQFSLPGHQHMALKMFLAWRAEEANCSCFSSTKTAFLGSAFLGCSLVPWPPLDSECRRGLSAWALSQGMGPEAWWLNVLPEIWWSGLVTGPFSTCSRKVPLSLTIALWKEKKKKRLISWVSLNLKKCLKIIWAMGQNQKDWITDFFTLHMVIVLGSLKVIWTRWNLMHFK